MAFNDLQPNQMVTFTDAQSGGFILKSGQSNPGGTKCMTKSEALTIYNLKDALMNTYLTNQLVPKSVWVSNSIPVSTIFGTTGSSPYGITIDSSGNIYTANYNSNNVTKITPSGSSSIFGTTGSNPREITIDSSGNIYAANYGSNNVTKITV